MTPILAARSPAMDARSRAFLAHWIPVRATGEDVQPEHAAQAPGEALSPGAEKKQLQILIIEDNRDYADGLQVVFEILGHCATVTYNGIDGLEAALRELPDVIVCDIGLPGLDGYEIARTLRQNPATQFTFLVAVTGYASDADRERAYTAGFSAHLAKPAEASAILALVASKTLASS